jgi:hypothetical protein
MQMLIYAYEQMSSTLSYNHPYQRIKICFHVHTHIHIIHTSRPAANNNK